MARERTRHQLDRLIEQQEEVRRQLDNLTSALVVRDPGGAVSADAYNGLRKSVNFAASSRRAHVRQLVQIMDAIENGATVETLMRKCEQWCMEAGLERVVEPVPDQPTWFRVVEGEGPDLEVLSPAWVDLQSGVVAQAGTARAYSAEPEPEPEVPAPAPEPEARTADEEAPDAGDGDATEPATEDVGQGRSEADGAEGPEAADRPEAEENGLTATGDQPENTVDPDDVAAPEAATEPAQAPSDQHQVETAAETGTTQTTARGKAES